MKWLTELVESSHSSLEVLPVPCLCEFLMASYQDQRGAPVETETDLSSHRAQYKRKKSAKEKVSKLCVPTLELNCSRGFCTALALYPGLFFSTASEKSWAKAG